jgi:lipopolysaccharide biosynthesis glycosyltransferase
MDGSNDFIYSRFLVPYLCGWSGHAIFLDGDMVVNSDITELWAMRSSWYAAQVVKHDYKTKVPRKYLGNKNEDYPKKNWSSVILWNCGHYGNRMLTPDHVQKQTGAHLHRFEWLQEERVGELPKEWNWLATEYPDNDQAKLIHYTLGTPCFPEYKSAPMAEHWHLEKAHLV